MSGMLTTRVQTKVFASASALILCLPLTIGAPPRPASENVQVRLRSAVDAVSAGAPSRS